MDITPRDPAGHFGQNPECNGTRSPKLSRAFAVGEAQVESVLSEERAAALKQLCAAAAPAGASGASGARQYPAPKKSTSKHDCALSQ